MEAQRDLNSEPSKDLVPLSLPPVPPRGLPYFLTVAQCPKEDLWHGLFYMYHRDHWTLMFATFSKHPTAEQAVLHLRERLEDCGLIQHPKGALAVKSPEKDSLK
jgi:hypothetical protein